MFSKLFITLPLCMALPLHCSTNLHKAQENYHNTPHYKEWQKFKEKLDQEKTLEVLHQQFFDAQRACIKKKSGFRTKLSSKCMQAQELSEKIVQLKNQLHELEEAAIQTHEGQEYLRQRQAFFGKK